MLSPPADLAHIKPINIAITLLSLQQRVPMSRQYALDRTATLKILLHSMKFPTTGVSGFLLGEEKTSVVPPSASPPSSPRGSSARTVLHIYDAIPVCHNFLTLTLPLELALAQLQAHCKLQKGKLRIVGYYQCNERLEDVDLGTPGRRIADRVEAIAPGSVALVVSVSTANYRRCGSENNLFLVGKLGSQADLFPC